MRYETLSHSAKMNFFQRLHKKLNHDFFDGELEHIFIDVQNISKHEDLWGLYRDGNEIYPKAILFSYEFEDHIEQLKTQKEQLVVVAYILCHEMVHQYCSENGIDDTNHSAEWQKQAAKRGVLDIYEDGVLKSAEIGFAISFFAMNMRIY